VNLIGRWSEVGPVGSAARPHAPATPLAGATSRFAIEDADGSRHVVLRSVVPGAGTRSAKAKAATSR
jgi:hypothetical protein